MYNARFYDGDYPPSPLYADRFVIVIFAKRGDLKGFFPQAKAIVKINLNSSPAGYAG
jgi:hypothetical protein